MTSWHYVRHTPGESALPLAARLIGEQHIVMHELSGLERSGYGWLLVDAQCNGDLEIWCVEAQRDDNGYLGLRFIGECEGVEHWDPPAAWLELVADVDVLYGGESEETFADQAQAAEWRALASILSAQPPAPPTR